MSYIQSVVERMRANNPNSFFLQRIGQWFPNTVSQTGPSPFLTGSNNYFPNGEATNQRAPNPARSKMNNPEMGYEPTNWGDARGGRISHASAPTTAWEAGYRGSSSEEDVPDGAPIGGSFKEGGLVGPQGMPVRPDQPMPANMRGQELGAAAPAAVDPKQLEAEARRFARQHPQEMEKVRVTIQAAIQSGELTEEELNMLVQLAKVALQNPASYPQIRQFAIQQGIGGDDEIPAEFDQGLLYVLLVVAQALGGAAGGARPAQAQAPAPMGPEGESEDEDGAVMAKVHEGEYVVPKEALLYHGKKTFDALVEKARGGGGS